MRGHMDRAQKETLPSLESYSKVKEVTHWTGDEIILQGNCHVCSLQQIISNSQVWIH